MLVHCDKGNTLPLPQRGPITSIMLQRGRQPETMTPRGQTGTLSSFHPYFLENDIKWVFPKVFADVARSSYLLKGIPKRVVFAVISSSLWVYLHSQHSESEPHTYVVTRLFWHIWFL